MRLMRMRDLADKLGIPRRTLQYWIQKDPSLSIRRPGPSPTGIIHWIKLDRLAEIPGISLTEAYMLGSSRWIKAVELARIGNLPRRTVAGWCKANPWLAKRIGRIYYIDLEQLGKDREDVEEVIRRITTRS